MISLHQHLDRHSSRSSIQAYAHRHAISYAASAVHLGRLKLIIVASVVFSMFYNAVVDIIVIVNLIEYVHITCSWWAVGVQLTWAINCVCAISFDAQVVGTSLLLMFASMKDCECRLRTLNNEFTQLVVRFRQKGRPSNDCVQKRVTSMCGKLSRLADEHAFANQLTSSLVGLFYVSLIGASVGYFFLFYFGDQILIPRQFFLLAIIFFFIPTLFTSCWLGQLLIDQVWTLFPDQ